MKFSRSREGKPSFQFYSPASTPLPYNPSYSPTSYYNFCPSLYWNPEWPYSAAATLSRSRRAELALEHYNKENGTNYRLVNVLVSNGFSSDGTWFHCNFMANQEVEGICIRKVFFAEIRQDFTTYTSSPETKNETVTACIILEGKTTVRCNLCNVIHPTCGFQKGLPKPECTELPTRFFTIPRRRQC